MNTLELIQKIDSLPENKKEEVLDFVDFMLTRIELKSLKRKPVFGSGIGMLKLKDNFDDPIDDFKEYM